MNCKPNQLCEVVRHVMPTEIGKRVVTTELCIDCTKTLKSPVWIATGISPMKTLDIAVVFGFMVAEYLDSNAGSQIHIPDKWLKPVDDPETKKDERDVLFVKPVTA